MRGHFYELLQVLFGFAGVPFQLLARLLHEIHPLTIAHKLQRGPYYWACVRKRRARGEDEWQELDLMIGIRPPEGHPYWARLERAGFNPLMSTDSPILREDPPSAFRPVVDAPPPENTDE